MTINSVAFFGSSTSVPGNPDYDSAYATAAVVAGTGRVIVNGGGPGIMLAATKGAKSVGGKAKVVYYKPELATDFEGSAAKNLADKEYEEQNYILRTKKLIELSDAFIIFKGGTGTLSEFAMAWGISRLYIGHHKPIILFGNFWKPIMDVFRQNLKIRREELYLYKIVTTPEEALSTLEHYDRVIEKSRHEHEHDECRGIECKLFI